MLTCWRTSDINLNSSKITAASPILHTKIVGWLKTKFGEILSKIIPNLMSPYPNPIATKPHHCRELIFFSLKIMTAYSCHQQKFMLPICRLQWKMRTLKTVCKTLERVPQVSSRLRVLITRGRRRRQRILGFSLPLDKMAARIILSTRMTTAKYKNSVSGT